MTLHADTSNALDTSINLVALSDYKYTYNVDRGTPLANGIKHEIPSYIAVAI